MAREMMRHLTKLIAGLITGVVREDSMGPVQFFEKAQMHKKQRQIRWRGYCLERWPG